MNATTVYFVDLTSGIPMLAVQVLIARAVVRKRPALRVPVYILTAIPFAIVILALPLIQAHYRPPELLEFLVYFWMFSSTPAYLIYVLIQFVMNRLLKPPQTDHRRRDLIRTAALAGAAAPFAVLGYGTFIERTDFGVTETRMPVAGLAPALEGFRILQISDVHRGCYLSQRDLVRVVDAARGLHYDLLVHTGDFITSKNDPLVESISELGRLQAPAGVFGCLGNHEIYAEVEDYATKLALERGIRILRAESQIIEWNGARFNLAGVDYQRFTHKSKYLNGIESHIIPSIPNILLSHNPDVLPVAASLGFDVTIAGHTHGGQVRAEILHQDIDPARFYTPFVRGFYQLGQRCGYVTRGIGSIRIPARIGSPPEITLLTLSRA